MRSYTTKWLTQRVTAILLIPLTFWFIYNCLIFVTMSYDQIYGFFASALNSFLFLIMMLSMLIHAKLGCETIVNDYIKLRKLKFINFLIINLLIYTSMIVVSLSVLKIFLFS
tara:strand:+ start:2352 stop:2687 length:336 start_codon:yes stop_codon:yes gene_type:complete